MRFQAFNFMKIKWYNVPRGKLSATELAKIIIMSNIPIFQQNEKGQKRDYIFFLFKEKRKKGGKSLIPAGAIKGKGW